jgi:hypothetical protein
MAIELAPHYIQVNAIGARGIEPAAGGKVIQILKTIDVDAHSSTDGIFGYICFCEIREIQGPLG